MPTVRSGLVKMGRLDANHWIVYNISATTTEFKEGKTPPGSLQGRNEFGQAGYGGPCPPSGKHRYVFKLYAIDRPLSLPEAASKEQVEKSMQGYILAETQLTGTYSCH